MTGIVSKVTRYSPAVIDPSAKTPLRMASAIAQHAARLYEARPITLGPRPVGEMNVLEGAHLGILEMAALEADLIEPDAPLEGIPSLWICPHITTSLEALAGMNRRDLMQISEAIRQEQPRLKSAIFTRPDGRTTMDLGSVIKGWADEALVGLIEGEGLGAHASMLTLARQVLSPEFLRGAKSIERIDRRIEDACMLLGLDGPAAIGTFLLRSAGIVDADTWRLGVPDGEEGAAGLRYALLLAVLANRAGIEHGGHRLQDAYEAIALGRLHGHAGAIANGGARNCEAGRPGAARFAMYRPATLLIVADAFLGTQISLGTFASVVAASALGAGEECQALNIQLAHERAEQRFLSQVSYEDEDVREALCSHLDPFLPSPIAGRVSSADRQSEIADRIAERLSQALLAARPQARSIGASARYLELITRIGAELNPG